MSNVLDERVEQLLRKDPRELATELATLQIQLESVDPLTRFIIQSVFKPWRFIFRDNKVMVGVLLNATFKPEEFIIWREEDVKDYSKKQVKHEKKYSKIKTGYLTYMDVIEFEEEKEWTDSY